MTKSREADTLKAILQYLASRHLLAFRMQSGALVNPRGRPVRFGTPGMADILCFTNTQTLWVECKSAVGKQSLEQKQFQQRVEERGHKYVICRSLDDVTKLVG